MGNFIAAWEEGIGGGDGIATCVRVHTQCGSITISDRSYLIC